MHPHQRSYSFSSWEQDSNYRSRSRDPTTKPLKKQYYYYNENIQSVPSFGDSSIHFNQPSFSAEIENSKNYLRMSRKSSNQHHLRYDRSIDSKDQLKKVNQQKIVNIEKINTKIKKILDTLNEQEKKISANNYRLVNKSYKKYGDRIKTEGDQFVQPKQIHGSAYNQLQNIKKKYQRQENNSCTLKQSLNSLKYERKSLARERINTQHNWMNERTTEKENNFDLKDNRQEYVTFKRQEQNKMRNSYLKTQDNFYRNSRREGLEESFTFHEDRRKQQNKKLFETPIKDYSRTSLKKSYLKESKITKNGKNIDEQIIKIQDKINSFEKIKKQLDIQCSPIQKNFVFYPSKKMQKENEPKPREYKYQNYEEYKAQRHERKSEKSYHQSVQKYDNPIFQSFQRKQQQMSTPKPFKLGAKKSSRIKEKPDHNIYKNIESQFVSEDRRTLQEHTEIKKFVKKICEQIQLDSEFRNLKKWFSKKLSTYKWIELSKFLSQKNIKLQESQIKTIFTLTQEEDNPFYTRRQTQGSVQDLVQSFIVSQTFWNTQIKNKFNKNHLQTEGISQMDMCRQGKIKIQDIVRYVNIESDNYFRNRDFSLIYRRFPCINEQVQMEDILLEVCEKI